MFRFEDLNSDNKMSGVRCSGNESDKSALTKSGITAKSAGTPWNGIRNIDQAYLNGRHRAGSVIQCAFEKLII